MAHFAELDEDDNVLRVIVVNDVDVNARKNALIVDGVSPADAEEQAGQEYCEALFPGTIWVQTSYNRTFRTNFAAAGGKYLRDVNAFRSPKPFPSWVETETHEWSPPVPYPSQQPVGRPAWTWNEADQDWV